MSAPENSGSEPEKPQTEAKKGLFDIQAKAPPASTGFDFQSKAPPLPPSTLKERLVKPAAAPRDSAYFTLLTGRLDYVLAGLALLLIVFLAAFPIWTSDVWMHLATGRFIAGGEYVIGDDSFSFASKGEWINHSWLYDWLIYVLYTFLGGPSLVILKVVLATALAAILFRAAAPREQTSAPARSNWFPAILSVSLAMLVLSPRLFLQPTLFSMLFLGITLWLLEVNEQTSPSQRGYRHLWILPPLFALWANIDVWFVLGPTMIVLCLVGLLVQRVIGGSPPPAKAKMLLLVLAVGIVACLVNPHHVKAFVLPPELAYLALQLGDFWPASLVASGKALVEMATLERQLAASPFGSLHFFGLGHNVAGKAYFVLLLLCIVSFAWPAYIRRSEGLRAFPWTRALLVFVFGILSALFARLVPFFAVIAGPIMALNFRDCAAVARSVTPATRLGQNLVLTGRVGSLLALGLLLFLAWPGWLHASVGEPTAFHRVGLLLEPDASYVEAARFLKDARHDDKVFNTASDFANYLAWFGGPIKGFADYRFGLFADAAPEYALARKSLRQEAEQNLRRRIGADVAEADAKIKTPAEHAWRRIFRDRGITQVSLHGYQRDDFARILTTWMLLQSDQWTLLYGDGRTLIFGLEEPGKSRRFPEPRETFRKLAFSELPSGDQVAEKPESSQADGGFWRTYAFGRPGSSLASAKANFHLEHFRLPLQVPLWQLPYVQSWEAMSWNKVAAVGAAAPGSVTGPATMTFLQLPDRLFFQPVTGQRAFLRTKDAGMPALPVLAVREALRAAQENPGDPQAQRLLAEAYGVIWHNQEDHWANYSGTAGQFLRQDLRRMQELGALRRAVALEPRDPELHWALAQRYDNMYLLDLAREHASIACKNLNRLPRRLNEKDSELNQRKQSMLQMLKQIDQDLTARREDFDLRTRRSGLLEKYRVAIQTRYTRLEKTKEFVDERGRGLALVALDMLHELLNDTMKLSQLSKEEQGEVAHGLVHLNILVGRWQEARQLLGNLEPSPFYHNYQAMLAASVGDYETLDKALAQMEKSVPVDRALEIFSRRAGELVTVFTVNDLPPHARILSYLQARLDAMLAEEAYVRTLMAASPLRTLRGVFALEQGDTVGAREHFQRAINPAGPQLPFVDRPIAARYLELMETK